MITPRFNLSQTESELKITVFAKLARIADSEIHIDDQTFIFYSSPYYLRLNLPGKLVDSEKEVHKINFDADLGCFMITCVKQTFGEQFIGLDMLTDLLTPKNKQEAKPLIEVVEGNALEPEDDGVVEEFDWLYEQSLPEEVTLDGYKYGFANAYNNVFTDIKSELCGVIDISCPDAKSPSERREERVAKETEAFSEDHYLADLFEKEDINTYLQFRPQYYDFSPNSVPSFTTEEEEILLKLPRKELLVDRNSKRMSYLLMVDLVLSWCYNYRISCGEKGSEAAWNIAKLSSSLSWLDSFRCLPDVVVSFTRRSLVYPLVRNWEFSKLVAEDATRILTLGKKQILKCLLDIHCAFNEYEPYYILNRLYIDDLCVWVQTLSENKVTSLGESLKHVNISKSDLDLELVELELAAQMVVEEESSGQERGQNGNLNEVIDSMDKLTVIENTYAVAEFDQKRPEEVVPLSKSPTDALDNCRRAPLAVPDSDSSSEDSCESDSDSDSDSSTCSSSSSSSLDSDDDYP